MPWAGVDGCKRGWVAVVGEVPALRVYDSFAALLADLPGSMIAADMPIGLPDRIVGGGRTPEKLVRAVLRDSLGGEGKTSVRSKFKSKGVKGLWKSAFSLRS